MYPSSIDGARLTDRTAVINPRGWIKDPAGSPPPPLKFGWTLLAGGMTVRRSVSSFLAPKLTPKPPPCLSWSLPSSSTDPAVFPAVRRRRRRSATHQTACTSKGVAQA